MRLGAFMYAVVEQCGPDATRIACSRIICVHNLNGTHTQHQAGGRARALTASPLMLMKRPYNKTVGDDVHTFSCLCASAVFVCLCAWHCGTVHCGGHSVQQAREKKARKWCRGRVKIWICRHRSHLKRTRAPSDLLATQERRTLYCT